MEATALEMYLRSKRLEIQESEMEQKKYLEDAQKHGLQEYQIRLMQLEQQWEKKEQERVLGLLEAHLETLQPIGQYES